MGEQRYAVQSVQVGLMTEPGCFEQNPNTAKAGVHAILDVVFEAGPEEERHVLGDRPSPLHTRGSTEVTER